MTFACNPNQINLSKLDQSVGKGGKNQPLDVLVIQRLLNGCGKKYQGKVSVIPDGLYGRETETQITVFQKEVVGMLNPDGLINVNKGTHKKLLELLSKEYQLSQSYYSLLNQKVNINTGDFMKLYKLQYPNEHNLSSLESLLNKMMADSYISDIRWVAYMLATVKRECGGTWKPIQEWGKGKHNKYGTEIVVIDPGTKKPKKNVYYGRGYVQLTWDYNYKKIGELLGLGDQLYINPDDVLNENMAYKIMSLGMRKGIFSNASLPQYLSGKRTDYVGARKIINGSDHAMEIATVAVEIEALLVASLAKHINLLFPAANFTNYV